MAAVGYRSWPTRDARDPGGPEATQQVTVDSVPSGAVDIRRELTVCATDGEIGQAQGLIVEPGGHQVTHMLLPERHMWGRKEVAIPIAPWPRSGRCLSISASPSTR